METTLEHLVWCPNCKTDYLSTGDSTKEVLCCPKCHAQFPVSDGVADLIPELKLERGRAQALMESPTMAKIYAGKLWRRSFWQGALLGIQFEREAALIIESAQVRPASKVLDLACASGIYTRVFAEAAPEGRVVGLDLSMPMLKVAAGIEKQVGKGNITYLRGTAQALPFTDSAFDCVNCCGALHLFPNPHAALAEISRVTKSGGRFTVATFRRTEGRLGTASRKTAESIGVNMFTPEGLLRSLAAVGLT